MLNLRAGESGRSLNKKGKALSRSKTAELLHNKLYCGVVAFNGVEYPGTHEPIVSKELFESVQKMFLSHDREKVRESSTRTSYVA